MRSFVHKTGPATPSMNLTPLIDIVFLLVVFFMLASTMVTKQSVKMIVPDLEQPETREMPEKDRIVVNIAPKTGDRDKRAPLDYDGKPEFVQIGAYGTFKIDDHEKIVEAIKLMADRNPSAEVYLRADAAIFYEQIEPIMDDITKSGIARVNLVAYLPEEAAN
ncbi:biopolymer transport protein ExbD [Poriferisphaera corsica]|uniref:Biopolymer transport protein ExbD n=1 Tax=Poriferisphaera corsica TaxID=2528020 RepID=A0A517YRQ7_9BACT|nr:biopolymer transporter ExbD [Poriferisphaera corsica]QDU32897.1 biopolymer transport protein ExbD [Poriferisphaera corsica]